MASLLHVRLVMRPLRSALRVAPVAASFLVAASSAGAQPSPEPSRRSVGLVAGVSQYDLSGTGTTPIVGVRADWEWRPWLLLEGALGALRPDEQGGRRARYFVPEAQLQLQRSLGVIRPYIGAGGGWFVRSGDGGRTTGTVSGAIGARVPLGSSSWLGRAELRVRGIGSGFAGSTAEWTVGAGYHF